MATICVDSETEGNNHWTYQVRVVDDAGATHHYQVSLSWSDYDLWSHGRVAPERVIKAAFTFLLEQEPAGSILRKFDCAVIRRYFPQVDRELPSRL